MRRGRSAKRSFASFDSATALCRALGAHLHGREFRALGLARGPLAAGLESTVPLAERLPETARERIYSAGGWTEALLPRALERVSAEKVAGWFVDRYPARRYPAVAIGSTSGALMHLCAALGIPFLPQTFLVPVRHPGLHPDEPRDALEWGREPGRRLLDANPELVLHHMHDPNQDRLMIARMAYFRVKWHSLPAAYRDFLIRTLDLGGRVLVSNCMQSWPTTRVGERHLFQFGAVGGADAQEMHEGSPRIERFLERYGSHRRRFDPPPPDGESPEAEWGFEPQMAGELERLAEQRGWSVKRVGFDEPDALSELAAEVHRRWYGSRGIEPRRLLVESFILVEPRLAVLTGSLPFWLKFPVESSADRLERYLADGRGPSEVRIVLFPHGTDSVGLAKPERWSSSGEFLGVDPDVFPRSFGTLVRYQRQLRKLREREEPPPPLSLNEFDELMAGAVADD